MKTCKLICLYALAAGLLASACSDPATDGAAPPHKVDTTGKEQTALASVPADVLSVVHAARPDLSIEEAEYEVRDGNEYYDVGGTLPDGSELELDMTRIDGVWTVVEFQRDIELAGAPGPVVDALAAHSPGWQPSRVIESDQGDGTVIYECFGADANGEAIKIEVKWTDGVAEVLRAEWQH